MEQWEQYWKDYYKILQVDFSAEPEVIEAAYKKLAKKYHTDHNPETEDLMKNLNEASEVLRDLEKKRRYDQEWHRKSGKHADSGRTYTRSPPKKPIPLVEPTDISFRDVSPGKIQKASFVIRNIGGPYKKIWFSDPKSWVRITSYTSLTTDDELPLKVEIEATSKDWGRSYSESIRVKLDEEETRIIITLKTRPKPVTTVSPAIIACVGIVALFIIVSIIVSKVGRKNDKNSQPNVKQIKNGSSQPIKGREIPTVKEINKEENVQDIEKFTANLISREKWDELVKKGDAVVDALVNNLKDADWNKRAKIAEVLGKIGSKKAIVPLTGLLSDDFAEVRKKTIVALGAIGDIQSVEPLRNVVARDSNSDVKSSAEDAPRKLLKETPPPLGKPYISDFDEIKRVLTCINESIQSRDIDKSCQFLSKEDNNFYSTERKKMEDFINEIQILNSSFDNINISMNEDTANVQYIWNMDFKSKLLGDNVKNNKCMVSLKLKKNGSKWEIFDIKKDSLYSEYTGDTKSNLTKLKQSITPSSHDTVPPKVSSVSPVNGTTDIMVDTFITITFSEAMDASTLNTSNIRLSGGTNGTVSYNLMNKTATFTPSSNLSYSTTYTTTVTTGVKDVNGNAISANHTWNFTTISKPPPITTQSVSTTYCQQCKEEVGPGHICDLTFFCHDCKKEVGDGHICGVTTFCPKCEEEVGAGHICDVTYFCYDCEKEVGDDHICGVTHFCPTCKAEAGEGHVCERTYFCFDCEKEMPKEHNH
ncbi:MAG: hypothetical protein A2Y11_01810 [Planctomycetes bacterium GWC2_39_26]|nr:MAG: hypothetical protein A2Y11_01810 [Planctomycetes bacterium GWC2_39_26]